MKKVTIIILIFLGGCSRGELSPMLGLELRRLPFFSEGKRLEVVYPYQSSEQTMEEDLLVESYGPSWRNLQNEYPEYRFNKTYQVK